MPVTCCRLEAREKWKRLARTSTALSEYAAISDESEILMSPRRLFLDNKSLLPSRAGRLVKFDYFVLPPLLRF